MTVSENATQRDGSVSLMTVPVELRLEIYQLVFAGSSKSVLRCRKELENQKLLWTNQVDISLLNTCHQLNHEALPVFYGSRTFYAAQLYGENLDEEFCSWPCLNHYMDLLVHLSLGLSHMDDESEKHLVLTLNVITRDCNRLRTLAINFRPTYSRTRLSRYLSRESFVAKTLHAPIRRLDALRIVVFGPQDTLQGLRMGITDNEGEWNTQKHLGLFWPALTISREMQWWIGWDDQGSTNVWETCRPGIICKDARGSGESSAGQPGLI